MYGRRLVTRVSVRELTPQSFALSAAVVCLLRVTCRKFKHVLPYCTQVVLARRLSLGAVLNGTVRYRSVVACISEEPCFVGWALNGQGTAT